MISEENKEIVRQVYKSMTSQLVSDVALHLDSFIKTCEETTILHEHDYKAFAQEAFCAALRVIHGHTYAQVSAVQTANNIINP